MSLRPRASLLERRRQESRLLTAALGLSLLGVLLGGCSLAGPSEHSFAREVTGSKDERQPSTTTMDARTKAKLDADTEACKSVAKQKGISSLLAMVKSANRQNTDLDYIACMKKKGWKAEGEPDLAPGTVSSDADQAPPSAE